MLDPAAMWILGIIIVVLPFVLSWAMHGTNQVDSQGRALRRRWRGRSLVPPGTPVPPQVGQDRDH